MEYDLLPGQRATRDIRHPDSREMLVKKNRKFTKLAIKKLKDSSIDRLPAEVSELVGKVAAHDVIDETTGEVLLQCNEELTESKLDELREHTIVQFKILFIDNLNVGSYLRDTPAGRQAADRRRRRSWRSTGACARGIRPRSRPRRTCSTTCSSTPSATTCPRSAG